MAVLLQDGDAEAVECVDVARVIVAGQCVDAAAHLRRCLVGECHAEDVARQDAELLDEVGKAVRERQRLDRASARQHAHEALCRRHRLALRGIESLQCILHIHPAFPFVSFSILDLYFLPFYHSQQKSHLLNNKNFTQW